MVNEINSDDDKIQERSYGHGEVGKDFQHHRRHYQQFHCWTSLRAIFGMMLPCCGSSSSCHTMSNSNSTSITNSTGKSSVNSNSFLVSSTSSVTGTIFGQRKGRVNFCVQEDPCGPPILLLEFAIPTHLLVKEMQSGLLRISLECGKAKKKDQICCGEDGYAEDNEGVCYKTLPLFSEPVWSLYCNGRKVGFAMRKTVAKLSDNSDSAIANLLSLMQSVSTGAGVIPSKFSTSSNGGGGRRSAESVDTMVEAEEFHDELIYMRATYERVVGSPDSEAFHMVSPDGSKACQELSIFLTRS